MKKMIFKSMKDLKKMMDIFEKHNVDYSWHFMNKRYEVHLGSTSADHIKYLLKEIQCDISFKWEDYYW